jgi:hypothetical protein
MFVILNIFKTITLVPDQSSYEDEAGRDPDCDEQLESADEVER